MRQWPFVITVPHCSRVLVKKEASEAFSCSFYDKDAPIYTMSRFLPPSKITNSAISRSILGDGCVVRSGCRVHHSVLGVRALINEGCTVEDSLIMGADYYETMEECALIPGCLAMGLGEPPLTSPLAFRDRI